MAKAKIKVNSSDLKKDKIEKIILSLLEFINKYKISLSIASGLILIILIIFLVYGYIKTSDEEKAIREYDTAVFTIQSLTAITNRSEMEQRFQNELARLNAIIQNYPKTIAAVRARLFLGRLMYQNYFSSQDEKSLEMAISYYTGAYQNSSTPFYKALSLLGRAECYEQKNEVNKAYEDYSLVVKDYKDEGLTPTALIGMARVKELLNDVDTALQLYKKVITEYPDSLWAVFAKGKVYFYESK